MIVNDTSREYCTVKDIVPGNLFEWQNNFYIRSDQIGGSECLTYLCVNVENGGLLEIGSSNGVFMYPKAEVVIK